MWPVPVVMIDEDLKNPLKVLLVQDQQPIRIVLAAQSVELDRNMCTLHVSVAAGSNPKNAFC
jgi:hypothetical protein